MFPVSSVPPVIAGDGATATRSIALTIAERNAMRPMTRARERGAPVVADERDIPLTPLERKRRRAIRRRGGSNSQTLGPQILGRHGAISRPWARNRDLRWCAIGHWLA